MGKEESMTVRERGYKSKGIMITLEEGAME
jgi:hypothetical protein